MNWKDIVKGEEIHPSIRGFVNRASKVKNDLPKKKQVKRMERFNEQPRTYDPNEKDIDKRIMRYLGLTEEEYKNIPKKDMQEFLRDVMTNKDYYRNYI